MRKWRRCELAGRFARRIAPLYRAPCLSQQPHRRGVAKLPVPRLIPKMQSQHFARGLGMGPKLFRRCPPNAWVERELDLQLPQPILARQIVVVRPIFFVQQFKLATRTTLKLAWLGIPSPEPF